MARDASLAVHAIRGALNPPSLHSPPPVKIMKKLFLGTLLSLVTSVAVAGDYTLTPLYYNADVSSNGTAYSGHPLRVGSVASGTYGRCAVLVFKLPKIPFGETVDGATFSAVVADAVGSPTFNGDLYSLGTSASPTVGGAQDYYQGTFGGNPNAKALQQHFLTSTTTSGRINANAAANVALANDIQAQLNGGANSSSYYFLSLNPDFAAASNANAGWDVYAEQDAGNQPTLTFHTNSPPQLGRVLIEYWTGIPSASLSSLTSSPNYPNKPSSREFATVMEIPQNLDVSSGDRLRGYFYPPTSGNYTFAVASDDSSSLLFSTDGNPGHATQIASVSGSVGYQKWNVQANQVSASFALTAGQVCYIESLHKQDSGNSNLSIGWMPPGASAISLMPTTNVAPYDVGANYSTDAISNSLQTLGHPRLMISPALIQRLVNQVPKTSATYNRYQAARWSQISSCCTSNSGLNELNGDMRLSGPLIGSTMQTPAAGASFIESARTLQDRVYALSIFYLMQSKINPGDPNIQGALNQIYKDLQGAANWGGGEWDKYAFLDLAETTHAFAIAYDWCYAGWTPTQRIFIVNTINKLALQESDGVADQAHNNENQLTTEWYFTGINANGTKANGNWPIVCNSGVLLGSLAILGDESTYLTSPNTPQAPTVLNTLTPNLSTLPSMQEWAPDGGWNEGPAYYNFAVRYLCALYSSLETSAATCFNLDKMSGMASVGSFAVYDSSPIPLVTSCNSFNFSDANEGSWINPFVQYLGLKYNQPLYSNPENTKGVNPLDMIWFDARPASTASSVPLSTYFNTAGVITLRNSWTDANTLFAGIKAGYNANVGPYGSSHEMEQIGTFVLDALGVRWAANLGSDSYSLTNYFYILPTANPNRWQYYRCRAEGSNTLVINPTLDGGQTSCGSSIITNFQSTSTLQQAVIDMTAAYSTTDGHPPNPQSAATAVTSAKRGLRFVGNVAQLQDEVTASASVPFYWFMHTETTVGTVGSNTLDLTSGNNHLRMTIQSPSGATFQVMAATPLPTSPNPSGQNPNTGYQKIYINLPTGVGTTTVTVSMAPYIDGNMPATPPAVTPLSGW